VKCSASSSVGAGRVAYQRLTLSNPLGGLRIIEHRVVRFAQLYSWIECEVVTGEGFHDASTSCAGFDLRRREGESTLQGRGDQVSAVSRVVSGDEVVFVCRPSIPVGFIGIAVPAQCPPLAVGVVGMDPDG
jgi:hypothetical protein